MSDKGQVTQERERVGHTKGPWHSERGGKGWVVRIDEPNGLPIANLSMQSEANARLIAAAPELLEALKACVQRLDAVWDSGMETEDDLIALRTARAAIAKAEGMEGFGT